MGPRLARALGVAGCSCDRAGLSADAGIGWPGPADDERRVIRPAARMMRFEGADAHFKPETMRAEARRTTRPDGNLTPGVAPVRVLGGALDVGRRRTAPHDAEAPAAESPRGRRARAERGRTAGVQLQSHNGGGGIRTHGAPKTPAGFQDRCIRPLCHPSIGSQSAGFPADRLPLAAGRGGRVVEGSCLLSS
jgi:hypothetical protein